MDETNPFQEDAGSSLSTPSVERISFTPERTIDASQSTLTDSDSRALPAVPASPVTPVPRQQPSGYQSEVGRLLNSSEDLEIQIVDAVKTADHSSSPYIVYVIRTGHIETRRRYSDFESFRNSMGRLYPTLIVPPIPSKQSLGDYAVKANKAKEDVTMIARRKRMLQTFLNRVAKHPILSHEYVFHRFLAADVSWSETLHSPPLSQLPKNILKAPAHDPLDTTSAAAYAALSSPSASAILRQPDQRFLDSENFTARFSAHISGNMEKVSRRTMKRWSGASKSRRIMASFINELPDLLTEYAHDHSELGAAINGFSLSESGALASSLEKTGQAVDATYMSTTRLLQGLEQTWTEPLQEYASFADIIRKLLQYRHQKHVQYEATRGALESKRISLEDFERSEAEARRLEGALAAAMGGRGASARDNPVDGPSPAALNTSLPTSPIRDNDDDEEEDGLRPNRPPAPAPLPLPPAPVPSSAPRRSRNGSKVGSGLFNALSHSIQGMMDVDPEAARRSNISKTKELISQLEDGQHLAAQDLKYASSTIQADLDRFQRQKVADIREMALAMARIHREWAKANLEAWEAARAEIGNIGPHPNEGKHTDRRDED